MKTEPNHTWSDSPIHEQIRIMNTQPTFETDAAYKNHAADMHDHIPLDFARRLERERDEAREILREIRDNEVNPEDEADKFLRDHVPSELSKVREQRDRLAEALRMITTFDYSDLQCDNGHGARSVAVEALQSLTQPKKYDANEHQSFYP